jgi:hypothetical protein
MTGTTSTTVWIYPPRDKEKKSYLAQWACGCPVPALLPFTSTALQHTLECADCHERTELDLATAIDAPNRYGIAPLTIKCPELTCRIATQIWHPLPTGTQVRINCAKCGRFEVAVMP